MKTLTQTEATEFHDEMLRIQKHCGGNEQRKQYKIQFRLMLGICLDADDKAKINTKCGFTINRMTDMVHWPVLLNVLLFAMGETLKPSSGYTLSSSLNMLVTAWCNDDKCYPKKRGSGVSRGYHINMLDGDQVTAAIYNLLYDGHSIQDLGHAAYLIGRVKWNVEYQAANPAHNDIDLAAAYSDIVPTPSDDTVYVPASFEAAVVLVAHYSGEKTETIQASMDILLARSDIYNDELSYDTAPVDLQSLCTAILTNSVPVVAEIEDEEIEDANPFGYVEEVAAVVLTGFAPEVGEKWVEPHPLDAALLPHIDALIKQAGAGHMTSISDYVDRLKLVDTAYRNAAIDAAWYKSQMTNNSAFGGDCMVDGATLTYEVVMRKAKDLFTDAHGRKSSKLDFEIKTLIWRNEDGFEVRHPKCPDIDETYKFRMHHLIKYLTAKCFGQHVWMHGHTGTGKTSFVEQVEARLGFPMERLNLDSNMERADIVGSIDIVVKDGAPMSQFTEGMLPKAMVQPMVFLLDEIDAGRPDMLFVLQRALENKGLTLTEDGGRLVSPHPLFMFAGTANSRGQGDEHGWYQGVRPMNLAFLNRFGAFIEVGYMDEDDERQFLKDAYPNLDVRMADQFAAFAQMVRSSFMNGELSQTVSPRNLHAMAQYYQHYTAFMSHEEAWTEVVETCVSDAAPADNQQRIVELSRTVFGGGL